MFFLPSKQSKLQNCLRFSICQQKTPTKQRSTLQRGMTRDDHPNVSDQLYANYAIGQVEGTMARFHEIYVQDISFTMYGYVMWELYEYVHYTGYTWCTFNMLYVWMYHEAMNNILIDLSVSYWNHGWLRWKPTDFHVAVDPAGYPRHEGRGWRRGDKNTFERSFERGSEQTITSTLPETNGSHITSQSWTFRKFNIAPEKWWFEDDPFLLGRPIFRCYLSLGECKGFFRMEL